MIPGWANAVSLLIGLATMLSVPGYFVLQPWALMTLERKWRIAAGRR
jgi:hypothetical protein